MEMTADTRAVLEDFTSRERAKDNIIDNYRHFARANYVPFAPDTLIGLGPRGVLEWSAVSSMVRTKTAKLVLGEFDQISPAERRRFRFVRSVVVSSTEWFVDLAAAPVMDVAAIKREIEKRFEGINFVGAIEPGFYPRWHELGMKIGAKVSWHAHLVVYTDDLDALHRALEGHCGTHRGPLFGVPSATDIRRSWKTAARWIAYACKSPAHSYTTRRIQEGWSPTTGVFQPEHDRQKRQDLRPGEHVKLRNVMRNFLMDDLLVSGGEGTKLLLPVYARMAVDRDQAHRRYRRPGDRSSEWSR
jgi:hypothetical protein